MSREDVALELWGVRSAGHGWAKTVRHGAIILSALDVSSSRGLPVTVVQQPTQPLPAPESAGITRMGFNRDDQSVFEALMIALVMVVRHEFANRLPQRAFSE